MHTLISSSLRFGFVLAGIASMPFAASAQSSTSAAAAKPLYTISFIPTFGGTEDRSFGVNDSGQVTGISYIQGDTAYHAFLSTLTGVTPTERATSDMGTLGGDYARGFGINASGQIAGDSIITKDIGDHAPLYDHAFLSGPTSLEPGYVGAPGPKKDLGTLGGKESAALGLNASAQVTGYASVASGQSHAFLSGPNGGALHDLGTLGGTQSYGEGVNAPGQVTGDSLTASGADHAFFTGPNGSGMRDLGTLGGTTSVGRGVNVLGQVAGYSTLASGANHAFLSGANGGALHDLGTLGGTTSFGYGVNDYGQAVGYSTLASGGQHAFVFSNGAMTDLNSLIGGGYFALFTLEGATSISNTGYIVGYGRTNTDHILAFVLTPVGGLQPPINPVPEASTTVSLGLLLMLGMGGVLVARKNAARAA